MFTLHLNDVKYLVCVQSHIVMKLVEINKYFPDSDTVMECKDMLKNIEKWLNIALNGDKVKPLLFSIFISLELSGFCKRRNIEILCNNAEIVEQSGDTSVVVTYI